MEYIKIDFLIMGMLWAWLVVNFSPIQNFIDKIIKPPFKNLGFNYIAESFSCLKCLSFWVVLAFSWSMYTAILAAIIAYLFDKIFNSFKTYL